MLKDVTSSEMRELKRDMLTLLKDCLELRTKRHKDTIEVQIWWRVDNEKTLVAYSEVRA